MGTNLLKSSRYQALDLWRGLICLFVVFEHAVVALWQDSQESLARQLLIAPFQTNWGTPLFFVISGYCIASSLESCRRRGTAPVLFLARRFWRVFPPYWVALLGFALLVLVLDRLGVPQVHRSPYALEIASLNELNLWQWIGNATLTETWRPRVTSGESAVFTRIAWSLCYQEQFYFVCFAILLLARKNLARTLCFATLGIVTVRAILTDVGALHRLEGTFPILWHQFAVGLGAFYVLNGNPSRVLRRTLLWAMALTSAAGFCFNDSTTAISALFGLLMIGLHRWDASWARLRFLEPLRALGRRSYSVYLAHLPVLILVAGCLGELGLTGFWSRAMFTVPFSVLLSIATSLIFYRFVESRFLQVPSYSPRKVQISETDCVATSNGLSTVSA